ncbi:MAG: acetate--CoA ligase family protein [Planctomycetota bacterium]
MSTPALSALFHPASVALVGASERSGSLGTVVLRNLIEGGFGGRLLPVNPKYREIQGQRAWADVEELESPPDLAIVCTPPATVAGILEVLARLGTRVAIVLSTGLTNEQKARVGRSGLRVLGPNSLGLIAPAACLNASFAHTNALAGDIGFVSQSGAMCTAVLDWARGRGIGFSALVSLGDALDLDFDDFLAHLGADASTRAILLYIESLQDARAFLAAVRSAAVEKPIVAIKAGRVAEGEQAAASHTGAMAGSDDVYDYALRRSGVLRVEDFDELFGAVETLQRAGPLNGGRLAILTNGGGPGVMATDAFVAGGGTLAELSGATLAALDRVLPAHWSRGNPIDVVGDADAARYRAAFEILVRDPAVDVILIMHCPTAMVSGMEAARAVIEVVQQDVPCTLLTTWLGGESVEEPRQAFARAGIATYDTPGDAVRALLQLLRHREARDLSTHTLPPPPWVDRERAIRARKIVDAALDEGREWLTGQQAAAVLEAYGVPVVGTRSADDPDAAAALVGELTPPVALKISSPDVVHKSDVGGVVLDLESADAVRAAARAMLERLEELVPGARVEGFIVQEMARRPDARELIIGSAVDPIFGPFVLFGQGGTAVELLDDRAVALPPLDRVLAEELVSRTRIAKLLRAYRDRPAIDAEALHELIVRIAELVVDVPTIVELDINPVLADQNGVLALDSRFLVRRAAGNPRQRLALRNAAE